MSTKPSAPAPWATDANFPAGAEPEAGFPTKVALSTNQATIGWRPGYQPPAEEQNTWQHSVGLWTTWLYDGDLTLNSLIVTTTLNIMGDVDFDQDVLVGDDLTVMGDLTVTMHTILDTVTVGDFSIFNALATFNDDALFASNKTVNFQGRDGKVNHGERRRAYSPPTFGSFFTGPGTGSPSSAGGGGGYEQGYTLSDAGGQVTVPHNEFTPGDRIKALRVTHEGVGNPTVVVHHHRYGGGPDFLATTIGATTTLGGGYKVTEYTVNAPLALNHHTAGGLLSPAYAQRASVLFEAGTNSTTIFGYEIVWDSIDVPADVV